MGTSSQAQHPHSQPLQCSPCWSKDPHPPNPKMALSTPHRVVFFPMLFAAVTPKGVERERASVGPQGNSDAVTLGLVSQWEIILFFKMSDSVHSVPRAPILCAVPDTAQACEMTGNGCHRKTHRVTLPCVHVGEVQGGLAQED